MKALDSIRYFLFTNHGDATVGMDSQAVLLTYPKMLRRVALWGMLLGFADIWMAMNKLWIHWPGASWLVIFTTAVFVFYCFLMILVWPRSTVQITMWIGTAWMALTQMFVILRWPGATDMIAYGGVALFTVLAAIGYLTHMPLQYRWSRTALGCWVILTQVAFIALWYAQIYYRNYVLDTLEPPIPYAEMSVPYIEMRTWSIKVITFGNGITMFLTSIYLYIVARKHKEM